MVSSGRAAGSSSDEPMKPGRAKNEGVIIMNASHTPKWMKAFSRVAACSNIVGTFWIILIMFIMTADVLGRLLFNSPLAGTPEIVKVSLVGIFFLQLGDTFWTGRIIRCDVFLLKMGAVTRAVIDILSNLVGLAMFAILFAASLPPTIQVWKTLEYEGEGALRVPIYPVRTLILLGSALTTVLFACRLIQDIAGLRRRDPSGGR
jgi:TRAP-type C4-dicarboxylate transport system permease small subunit